MAVNTPAPMGAGSPTHALKLNPTRSVLGPLTTAFHPPEYCSRCYLDISTASRNGCHLFKSRSFCDSSSSVSACLPGVKDYDGMTTDRPFYSPAFDCPRGWSTAATASHNGAKGVTDWVNGIDARSLLADETAAVCCPSGFAYQRQSQQCVKASTPISSTSVTCPRSETLSIMTADGNGLSYYLSYVGPKTNFAVNTGPVFAPAIQINHRPRDRVASAALTTHSTHSSPRPTSATSFSASATSESNIHGEQKSESGLGGGAIAGIVIGVVALFLGAICFFVWLWFYRRRWRRAPEPERELEVQTTPGPDYKSPEMQAAARLAAAKPPLAELEGTTAYELNADNKDAGGYSQRGHVLSELPGSGAESMRGVHHKNMPR